MAFLVPLSVKALCQTCSATETIDWTAGVGFVGLEGGVTAESVSWEGESRSIASESLRRGVPESVPTRVAGLLAKGIRSFQRLVWVLEIQIRTLYLGFSKAGELLEWHKLG